MRTLLVALILFFWTSLVFGATYIKTVDPNGGADYLSISAWEAGEQGLYSSGDIAIADCRRAGPAKDTTVVEVTGWNAGVIVKVIVNPAYRHEGKYADQRSDGNYIYCLEPSTVFTVFRVTNANVYVYGLLSKSLSPTASIMFDIAYSSQSLNYLTLDTCIIGRANYGVSANTSNPSLKVFNTLFFGCNRAIYSGSNVTNSLIYNSTAYGGAYGFVRVKCINTVALGQTAGCYLSPVTGSNYNVSSDTSAPGTNKATGKTAYTDYFVDPANGDFHLKGSSSTLWGLAGTNLSGTFTTDIDGQTRTSWDIGADEYVVAGGGGWTGKVFGITPSKVFGISPGKVDGI